MEQKTSNKLDFTPPETQKKPSRFKAFLHSKPPKKRLLIVLATALLVLIGGTAAIILFTPQPEPVVIVESEQLAPKEPEPPTTIASPLTGSEVEIALAERPVTAVMIENSIDARPQSGLADAGIVFEAIAEGGITRFMALYQESRPSNIGPIRSARPYYVRWAAGYEASFLHSGGSPEALALIRSIGIRDLDHGALGESIASRVSSRYAPHNVYSNFDRIDAKNTEFGYTKSNFTAFTRKADSPPTAEAPATASSIQFNISGPNYNTSYTYDPATNSYKRVMAGLPHTDQETGTQITPKVVVGLVMGYSINSNGIHSIYDNVGSGEALVFQDGILQNATWRKTSDIASLELLDSAGTPLALNSGQTWITAVPAGRISYTP
jgi:hypothetical protein